MRIKSKISVIVGTALMLAGIGAGVAFASIPDSGGVIHACYQNPPPAHGANLQVIDTGAGGSCSGGMTQVTWNQTGPQGPQGATGPQGPAGPSTAGPSGLDLIVVQGPGNSSGRDTATCPSDHPYVVGGGFSSVSTGFSESIPYGTGGWLVQDTGFPNGPGAQAFVICAK